MHLSHIPTGRLLSVECGQKACPSIEGRREGCSFQRGNGGVFVEGRRARLYRYLPSVFATNMPGLNIFLACLGYDKGSRGWCPLARVFFLRYVSSSLLGTICCLCLLFGDVHRLLEGAVLYSSCLPRYHTRPCSCCFFFHFVSKMRLRFSGGASHTHTLRIFNRIGASYFVHDTAVHAVYELLIDVHTSQVMRKKVERGCQTTPALGRQRPTHRNTRPRPCNMEQRVKQCQTRMEGGALTKLMLQVVDMDPDIVLPSLRFLRFQVHAALFFYLLACCGCCGSGGSGDSDVAAVWE